MGQPVEKVPAKLSAQGRKLIQRQVPVEALERSERRLQRTDGLVIPGPPGIAVGQVDKVWRGYPDFYVAVPPLYRADLFQEAGLGPPQTWDDLRAAGRALKPRGHPCGMGVSHCNDANHNWRAVMWAFGAHEVGADGSTVTVNSPEMHEALKFMKAMFDEGMTLDVFDWDDSSDNKYLVSEVGSWVHDAISAIRIAANLSPDLAKKIVVSSGESRAPMSEAVLLLTVSAP